MSDFGRAFEDLLAAFDRLEIRFAVGGSVASGTHAFPRFTQNIDIVAEVTGENVDAFCNVIQSSFYIDRDTALRSIRSGRAFNVVHTKFAFKFDVFPATGNPFVESELARGRYTTTKIAGLEGIEFPVASPEDVILSKLDWYRKGGETSERQWNDILDVLQVCRPRLDLDYLKHWAATLGVADLLNAALAEPHRPR